MVEVTPERLLEMYLELGSDFEQLKRDFDDKFGFTAGGYERCRKFVREVEALGEDPFNWNER